MTEIVTKSEGSLLELDHQTFMQIVRTYAQKVALLAKRGDPLSATVKGLWENLFEHPMDQRVKKAFRAAFVDWMKQNLEITARTHLANKYGYLVEGEDPSGPPKIVTLQ